MKINFTTVVSNEYLYKFLVMYRTLKHHCPNFILFAMAVDKEVHEILNTRALENVVVLQPDTVKNQQLSLASENRPYIEYCWLLKPITLMYVMKNYRDTDYYAHIDSDLCFFGNPEFIFNESPKSSLFLTDHNNSQRFIHTYKTSGRFNTGFVGCKNDSVAIKAVKWWEQKCFESSSSIPDPKNKIFGDQRYVERWSSLFGNTHVIKSKGVNVAVWNIEGYEVKLKDSMVLVNKDILIFYHFSGFQIINEDEFSLTWFYPIKKEPLNLIYLPYMRLMNESIKEINQIYPKFKGRVGSSVAPKIHRYNLKKK